MKARIALAAACAGLCAESAAAEGLEGAVVDHAGAAVDGAWVQLLPPDSDADILAAPLPRSMRTGPTTAVTDSGGRFRLRDAPPGRHIVKAYEIPHDSLFAPRIAHVAVEVPVAGTGAARVQLDKGLAIRGRVVGPDGAPLPAARIGAVPEPTPEEAETLRGAGGVTGDPGSRRGADGVTADPGSRVEAARRAHERLARRHERLLRRMAELQGPMPAGAPAATRSERKAEDYWEGARRVVLATTGRDGTFEANRLHPVTHVLVAFKSGYAQHGVVRARPGEDVVLRLSPAGTLRGRVVDDQGRPIPSFSVEAPGPGAGRFFDGAFEIPVEADGEWIVRIRERGSAPVERRATVAAGRVTEMPDAVLSQGRTLEVRLENAMPALDDICYASLRVRHAGVELPRAAEERQDFRGGRSVSFDHVPTVPAKLSIVCGGHMPVDLDVGPKDGVVNVRLADGVALAGRIVDEKGAPWPHVEVATSQTSGNREVYQHGVTDADGRFRVTGLLAGGVRVKLRDAQDRHAAYRVPGARLRKDRALYPPEQELTLPASGEVRLDARLAVRR